MPFRARLYVLLGAVATAATASAFVACSGTVVPTTDGGPDATGGDAGDAQVSDAGSDATDALSDVKPFEAGVDASKKDQINAFIAQGAKAFCDRTRDCCSIQEAKFQRTMCEASLTGNGLATSSIGVIELQADYSNVTFDAVKAASCIAKLGGFTCGDVPTAELSDMIFGDCSKVILGTQGNGGACKRAIECTSGLFCERMDADGGGAGTCKPIRAVGAACGDFPEAVSHQFDPTVQQEACSYRQQGITGFCDDNSANRANWKCTAPAADGTACAIHIGCQSRTCGGATGVCGQPVNNNSTANCSAFIKP